MDEISLSEIGKLRNDFDVFSEHPGAAPSEEAASEEPARVPGGGIPYGRYGRRLVERGIYPPLPVMGEYLVWGFRLLDVFRAADTGSVRTVRLPDAPAEAVAAALNLEDRRDEYSWKEKERLAELIERFRLSGEEKRRIEGLVQTKGSFLASLIQYRPLPAELKRMVEAGALDLKTAWTVRGLPEDALPRLRGLAADISFSRRRELFVLTAEVAIRDDLSGSQLSDFLGILEEAADPAEAVRRARFPELEELEENFGAFKERFLAGSGIDLRAPKNFEGSRFSVAFSFETDRQLDRILGALHTLRDNTNELYRLLYGPLRPDLSD